MKNSKIESILSSMSEFRNTDGLIIDVRGNGGGKYGILRALYGYFVPEDALPYVTNIAAYRLSPRFKQDYLHYRHTYRMEHPSWTSEQRKATIRAISLTSPTRLISGQSCVRPILTSICARPRAASTPTYRARCLFRRRRTRGQDPLRANPSRAVPPTGLASQSDDRKA